MGTGAFAGVFWLIFATASADGSWEHHYAYRHELWRDCNSARADLVRHFAAPTRNSEFEGVVVVVPECVKEKPMMVGAKR